MRKVAFTAALAVTALALAACSGGGDPGPGGDGGPSGDATFESADPARYGGQASYDDMAALYAAAQDAGETTVVVYGAVANEREAIFRQFEREFPGITVQTEFLTGSDLFGRINQEVASGTMMVDAVLSGDTSVIALKGAGRLDAYEPVLAAELADQYRDPDGQFVGVTATAFGVAYNTDRLSEDEVPHSWDDMLDPKYRGQLAWVDLTGSGPSLVPMARLIEFGYVDEAWLQDLKAQEVHFEGRATGLTTVLTTGEYPIVMSYPYDYYLRDQENQAPVGFFFPLEEANYVALNSAGVVADGPHPNAAKLLLSWLLTPAATDVFVEIGQYSVMPGSAAPEGLPPLEDIHQLEPAPWDQIQEVNDRALEITKRIFS